MSLRLIGLCPNPRFFALVSKWWKRRCRSSRHRLITCKPRRALGSLLSVALSSLWVKLLHFNIQCRSCQCSTSATKVLNPSDATAQSCRLGVLNLSAIFIYLPSFAVFIISSYIWKFNNWLVERSVYILSTVENTKPPWLKRAKEVIFWMLRQLA